MKNVKRGLYFTETLVASVVIIGINLFLFPRFPGFSELYFGPFIIVSLFFAVYGGLLYGFISLVFSFLLIYLPLPYLIELVHFPVDAFVYWTGLLSRSMYAVPAALILVYVFGVMHKRFTAEAVRIRGRYKELVKRNHRLAVQGEALFSVFQELEERLSRQQESIMTLYNQVKKVNTVSTEAVLEVLLETVRQFTRAESASVWKYSAAAGMMQLTARTGWDPEESANSEIPVDQSIEGWVVRNNQFFSIRMLVQYDNLRRLDQGRNLITFPIQIENRIWGVLNIEEMPFIKYNQYTERLLFIIISLIEPALQKAVAYESLVRKEEVDTVTGLPLFTSFYKVLSEEIKRKSLEQGKLSIIITEIVNFSTLVTESGRVSVQKVIPPIVQKINDASGYTGQPFEYKEDNQIAFIFPNLDYDGASLYCLEILEILNGADWKVDGKPVMLEAVIGYSSYSGTQSPDELIELAENLLQMQKV